MPKKFPPPTKAEILRFREALAFIEGFSNISFRKNYGRKKRNPELFIRRTRRFLNLIGSPDKDFKFIHVTGTAGKGTVSTMVHNALVSEGKRVGLFTSPYTTTAIEKIKVNNLYISPVEFAQLVKNLIPFVAKAKRSPAGTPSTFELFLAIALLYFKKMKCEWVVLEAGLGGRYDATNVIKSPRVTAITNIDFDHTEILGKTLREIATDKGGIIKKGSFFLTTETRPRLLTIFKSLCRFKGGKFMKVRNRGSYRDKNLFVILAISNNNKDSKAIIKPLIPLADEIVLTSFSRGDHNSIDSKDILPKVKHFKRKETRVSIIEDMNEALNYFLAKSDPEDCVLVTGSFFLAGQMRKRWYPEDLVLKKRKSF